MILKCCIALGLLTRFVIPSYAAVTKFATEDEFENFLKTDYDKNISQNCYDQSTAHWNHNTDLGNQSLLEIYNNVTITNAKIKEYFYKTYFEGLKPKEFKSKFLQRVVKKAIHLNDAALPHEQFERLTIVINEMNDIVSKARICPFSKQQCDLSTEGLSLPSDLKDIMISSTDIDELAYVWTAWRNATGPKVADLFEEYVKLKNTAAVADGYKNAGDMWRSDYETLNLPKVLDEAWKDVRPLYHQLHTYVSAKLSRHYGDKINVTDGLLPAHILGNIYAQNWESLIPIVKPYPEIPTHNITDELISRNYTVLKMFETANKFFTSMGLEDMSSAYGNDSIIEKPSNKEMACHPTAWDFCDRKTYRTQMCAKVDKQFFHVIHHELGHIQYFMLYKNQSYVFRGGSNSGFHEAIGDAITLSVMKPVHYKKIGLIKQYNNTVQERINELMEEALKVVPFLPYSLIVDKWRWDVFSGRVPREQWNNHWWKYRMAIQKVKPPVERTSTDFDIASKHHIVSDTQYIEYFLSHIFQFQLYRGLCIAAKRYNPNAKRPKPLHSCDFYKSKKAGTKLKAGLSLGSSVHWTTALKKMTKDEEIDTTAIMDYFKPLYNFLKKANRENKD